MHILVGAEHHAAVWRDGTCRSQGLLATSAQKLWRCTASLTRHASAVPSFRRSVKLGLMVLKEARKGTESFWHLWLEALPRQVQTLIHWSDAELQELQMDSTSLEKKYHSHVRPVRLAPAYTATFLQPCPSFNLQAIVLVCSAACMHCQPLAGGACQHLSSIWT